MNSVKKASKILTSLVNNPDAALDYAFEMTLKEIAGDDFAYSQIRWSFPAGSEDDIKERMHTICEFLNVHLEPVDFLKHLQFVVDSFFYAEFPFGTQMLYIWYILLDRDLFIQNAIALAPEDMESQQLVELCRDHREIASKLEALFLRLALVHDLRVVDKIIRVFGVPELKYLL